MCELVHVIILLSMVLLLYNYSTVVANLLTLCACAAGLQ